MVSRIRRAPLLLLLAALAVSLIAAGPDTPTRRTDPDRKLTPGAVVTTDRRVVCRPGYAAETRARRRVTQKVLEEVARDYGVPVKADADRQLDHFKPIALGGCPDCKENLWYQYAEPRPGYAEKDWVENVLHALVCARPVPLMTLDAAQDAVSNWVAIYLILFRSDSGEGGAAAHPWARP